MLWFTYMRMIDPGWVYRLPAAFEAVCMQTMKAEVVLQAGFLSDDTIPEPLSDGWRTHI